ncbi:C40 family peptidase [Roseovarius sp. ZX-A-9]|uniref:C40 family peptidase n=1 Tax=Roseovarius sp. ZX-A-9 TaxID=3014783 RepID=UPI00232CBF28|nr:NlpC/P60 family protein [Roseovarius sp. ZX-A-9]
MTRALSDRRFRAANARVAHVSLRGHVDAPEYVEGEVMRCSWPFADLCRSPNGPRDLQILRGQPVRVLEIHAGWAFVIDEVGGYVGYLPEAAVVGGVHPTHRVGARLAHVYAEPDIKSRETALLSFFAEVEAGAVEGGFHALAGGGYMVAQHLVPLGWYADDAVAVAEMFLGTPYLWGGNTGTGVDCSGLVQLAQYAQGRACPRDSDLQQALGQPVEPGARLRRGDLVFWKGHVGILQDAQTLLHANAFHMAVTSEPLQDAIDRIAAREFGAVTAIRRIGETP